MSGLIVLLLAIAIPLGIVVIAVVATESEHKAHEHAPVSRLVSAIVFGIATLLGALLVFRAPAIAFILGVPAAVLAAILAVAGHRLVVGRSKILAAISGASIAFLTAVGTSAAFAVIFAPDHNAALFVASFGTAIVLLPQGIPVLLIGASVGVLLSYISNRKRHSCNVEVQQQP